MGVCFSPPMLKCCAHLCHSQPCTERDSVSSGGTPHKSCTAVKKLCEQRGISFFFFFSHHFESSKRPLVAIFTALLLPSASKQNRRLDFFLIPAMPCLSMQPTNRHSMLSNVSSVSQLWYTWQKSFFEIMEICILIKTTSFMKQAQCNKEEKLTFQEFQTGLHHNSHPLCKENIL